jgi:hypothetical protein
MKGTTSIYSTSKLNLKRERCQKPMKRIQKNPAVANNCVAENTGTHNFSLESLSIERKPPEKKRNGFRSAFIWMNAFLLILYVFQKIVFAFLSFPSSQSSILKLSGKQLRKTPLPMLPKPGEYAPIRKNNIIPLIELIEPLTSEYHVFAVSSEMDLAFTVLSNVLIGIFDKPDEHLSLLKWSQVGNQYMTRYKNKWADNNVTIVSATHETATIPLQREFRLGYRNLFFFVVDRGQAECLSPQEFIMICIPQSDLFYEDFEEKKLVVGRIVQRMQQRMPYFSRVDFSKAQLETLRRLDLMDEMQKQMQDLPSTSVETKYGINGGVII